MRQHRYLMWLAAAVLLGGCSSSSEVIRYSGSRPAQAPAGETAAAEDHQRQVAEEGAAIAGSEAREEAMRQARAESARRVAEEEARLAAEAAREEEAERRRLAEAEAARRREAEEAARQARVRAREAAAREVAAKQARVEELRERIEANERGVETLQEANAVLAGAVTAAENLSEALTREQEKYSNTDPETGATAEPLDKATLEALAMEKQRLSEEADRLMSQVP